MKEPTGNIEREMDADVFRRPEIGLVQEMQRISNANSCITDELLWRVTRASLIMLNRSDN